MMDQKPPANKVEEVLLDWATVQDFINASNDWSDKKHKGYEALYRLRELALIAVNNNPKK